MIVPVNNGVPLETYEGEQRNYIHMYCILRITSKNILIAFLIGDILALLQEFSLSPQGVAALTTPQALLWHMQGHSIHCIASGGHSPNFKFFFFAQKAEESSNFLVECIINTSSAKAQVKIKADDQSTSQAFSDVFQSALSKFSV